MASRTTRLDSYTPDRRRRRRGSAERPAGPAWGRSVGRLALEATASAVDGKSGVARSLCLAASWAAGRAWAVGRAWAAGLVGETLCAFGTRPRGAAGRGLQRGVSGRSDGEFCACARSGTAEAPFVAPCQSTLVGRTWLVHFRGLSRIDKCVDDGGTKVSRIEW